MIHKSKIYYFIRISFLEKMAYTKAIWFDIFSTLIAVFIYYFFWKMIFGQQNEMAGYTMAEITTYVILSKILSSQFGGGINEQFAGWIYDGSIGMELLRPVTLIYSLFGKRCGEFCFFVIFKGIPVMLISFVLLNGQLPVDPIYILLFFVSVLLSIGILFSLEMFVGMACFYTLNHYGLTYTKKAVLALLSGGIVPLFLFPESIAAVLNYLPFAGMVSIPVNIFLGKYEMSEIGNYLLLQCLWGITLYVLMQFTYRRIIKKVVVQGG